MELILIFNIHLDAAYLERCGGHGSIRRSTNKSQTGQNK